MSSDILKELLGMEPMMSSKTPVLDTANSIDSIGKDTDEILKRHEGFVFRPPVTNASKAPDINGNTPFTKYPRTPSGQSLPNFETVQALSVEGDSDLPFVQITMVGGEIVSAKNEDGTDNDTFNP